MNNQSIINALSGRMKIAIAGSVLVLLGACGEVDKDDGTVTNGVALPTDSALRLYCPDAGIAAEPCVLDDPQNPYAITPLYVEDGTRFELSDAAPSAKARFYLWATAQALSPRGENQFYVGQALHEMYSETGSELARTQALSAYRSVLDNYFYSATFFECDFGGCPADDLFYPFPVRQLVGTNLHSPAAPLTSLFDNVNEAFEIVGQWGYTYSAYDAVNNPTGTNDFTVNR